MLLLKVLRITLQLFALMAIAFACGIAIGNTKAVIDPFAVADSIITMSLWTAGISFAVGLTELAFKYRRSHATEPENSAV